MTVMSADDLYRYVLTRVWGDGPRGVYIMLNPSTADAVEDDATIRKCRGFATRRGWGGFAVVNLYAWRSRDPAQLRRATDPVGPSNDYWIQRTVEEATGPVVAAWGAQRGTDRRVREVLLNPALRDRTIDCYGTTRDGHPRHPLMLGYSSPLMTWRVK